MDRSDEILANPHFARFMAIQEELKSMGYFCISTWSTGDIQEEFTSSFSDAYERSSLSDTELTEIQNRLESHFDKGNDITNSVLYDFIQDILNDR